MRPTLDWVCDLCGEVVPNALTLTTRTEGRQVIVTVGPVSDLADVATHVWSHAEGVVS